MIGCACPNGGNSYRLVVRRGPLERSELHVDTEWDPPHRGFDRCTIDDPAEGGKTLTMTVKGTTVTTFVPVSRGTRMTTRHEIRTDKGGLYAWFAFKVFAPRERRRHYRRVETAAKGAASGPGERSRPGTPGRTCSPTTDRQTWKGPRILTKGREG